MSRYLFLSIIFISLISNRSEAASDSLFFSTLSIRDGLPSNIINSIAQDKNDFIWIGTSNGLCRYDGHRFITFKREGSNSLPANEISSLLIDGDFIWVGTWKGLCKINTLTFEVVPIDLKGNNIIRTLCKGYENNIWIGTTTGLIKYSKNGLIEYNTANSNISHNTIRAIHTDKFGNLWVGTYDKVNKLPKGQNSFVQIDLKRNYKPELKNNLICDIKPFFGNDSLIWVGTETGLCQVNVFSGNYHQYNEKNIKLSNEVVKNIYTDDKGNLWLGTDFGLNILTLKNFSNKIIFHNPQLPYSIANNVIWQIMEDSGGVIWFVTSNGLSRLNKYRNYYTFHEVSYSTNGQTIGNQVRSMLITKQKIMWLATQHGALRINLATGEKKMFDTQSTEATRILLNNVYALEEDDYSRIWIGTAGGINVWDESKQKMYAITSSPTNGLITNYISKFTKGTDGSFWVSAWEGGLFKITGNFENINSLHFELVGDFGSEKNVSGGNAIWAINYNELYRIDFNTYKNTSISSFNEVSNKRSISCLYFSKKGSLWAGTLNGLIEYKPQTDTTIFHPLVTGNDLKLTSITDDGQGNIWGAAGGFILKYCVSDQHIEIFPMEKDAPLKSFFDGCFAKTQEGEILFGGDNGYISISSSIKPVAYKPNVHITSLEVNNKKVNAGDKVNGEPLPYDVAFMPEITLDYAYRSIAIEFAALHYWQPEMNMYAYKLEGLESHWNYVSGKKNSVVYSNLSPGAYTLIVKGTNNYGIWSDSVASIKINVNPPLFLSKGFLLLYAIIAILIIIVAIRFYSSRLHLRNELKIIRMERDHAEEIASVKQQFFTNISHELRTPISLIIPPIQQVLKRSNLDTEVQSLMRLAEKNSQRLLRVVNQILDFRKLENDSLELKIISIELVSFCKDIFVLFSDKATRNQIQFTFQTDLESCKIWADEDKLETILYNLLSNAFKFTPNGGSVDLIIEKHLTDKDPTNSVVEIKVKDTGIGIAPEDQPKIFDRFFQTEKAKKFDVGSGIGLTMVAEYTKLHYGKVTVESYPEKGSCFTITLPLSHVHFPIDPEQEPDSLNLVATKTTGSDDHDSNPYIYDLDSDKPLVLIVEDNTDMIDFLRINLKDNYYLIIAKNGEEALQKTNSILPEVIISDIMMPIMDGITLTKKIKENSKTSHIGIILLTAKNLMAQKIEGIRVGADAYLTKPFEVELLVASIDHLLKRKQELSNYFKLEILTHPEFKSNKENLDDKFVKKVSNIIEANISNPDFNVEILSREIGMSSTHLYRKLKSLTHYSAKDIIKKYRLKKASLLLKNNEGNISEIMYEVGFSSLSYFAKCFKSEFGLSPKDYQQKMSKGVQEIEI